MWKQGECVRPGLKQLKLEYVQDQMNHDFGFLSICWVVIRVMILSDILFLFLTSIVFTTFCPYQLSHSCPSSQSASSVPPQLARSPLLFQNLTFPSIPYVPWFYFFLVFSCVLSLVYFSDFCCSPGFFWWIAFGCSASVVCYISTCRHITNIYTEERT